jgi:DNA-directed RNA polymerase subunit RPC12/RpoP
LRAAEAMYERLHAWRSKNLDASFDEIAEQVTPQRRELMGVLLKQLAETADEKVHAPSCEQCGGKMVYKGTPARGVVHSEGEAGLARAYYHCPDCESGLFPPRPSTATE